jgi:hypothetical protein
MGWEVPDDNRPLPRSLGLVASLGLRDGLAKGYAIHQLLDHGEAWERKAAEGLQVPESDADGLAVISYALGTEETPTGALSFVLGTTVPRDSRRFLEKIAKMCQAIWGIWHIHAVYARHVLRIAELEAELADAKIADRAQAMLQMEEAPAHYLHPVDIISRSVHTILGPYQLQNVLKRVVEDLERDTAEYELVRRAKGFLQERQNITEAQAYLHLRLVSRQTRRPLPDVASELMKLGFVSPRTSPRSPRGLKVTSRGPNVGAV